MDFTTWTQEEANAQCVVFDPGGDPELARQYFAAIEAQMIPVEIRQPPTVADVEVQRQASLHRHTELAPTAEPIAVSGHQASRPPPNATRQTFPEPAVYRRFGTQQGLCALCDARLTWKPEGGERRKWDCHHIDGNRRNSTFANLAIVCARPCHLRAHCGEFGGPFVLQSRRFRLRGPAHK